MSLTRQLRRSSQTLLLVMVPHGGQATARRNAQAGMSAGAGSGAPRPPAATAVGVPEQRPPALPADPASTPA